MMSAGVYRTVVVTAIATYFRRVVIARLLASQFSPSALAITRNRSTGTTLRGLLINVYTIYITNIVHMNII